ncbi:MAG: efflux RND transporter periplasmic adaptor subunit [Verrucomicrobiae bacterium]|nr:efflux RND transporter periplasmic adaptor subunit [Verrucomicrobiae bacterium]
MPKQPGHKPTAPRQTRPLHAIRELWNRGCRVSSFIGLLGLAGGLTGCSDAPSPPQGFAQPVVAAPVLVRDQPIYVENIGQTRGAQDVEIRARVAGFLESVNFTEGTFVTNGMLLYTIDAAPFRAALAQAHGLLAQAEATWQKSQRDTNRLGPLWEKNAISRQQYDDAVAAERASAANVQAAQAAVDTARIQLDYTTIHAPIDGIVGKTEVKAGNLVGQGQATLLTTISSVDPIRLRFSVSERDYLAWRRTHSLAQPVTEKARGEFELLLADGTMHPHRGDIVFADREVDARTGTLLLEVAFPNPERIVRPGQFGRVRFPLEIIPDAVLVPQRAVQELQANFSVFIVTPENTAQTRRIEPGPRVGPLLVVRSGLQAGDKVVIEGIQKLQDRMPLAVTWTNLASTVSVAGDPP